jgi:glycosyltransferase involved in cell wall biosynthesis
MNILHVVPGFYPAVQYGGPARSVFEIARRQAKRGHNVTVFTTNLHLEGKVDANKPQLVEGITLYYFDYSRLLRRLGAHFIVSPKMKTIAEKTIQARLFDVVHLHEMRNYFSPIIARLCSENSTPYVVTPRGTLYSRGVSVFKKRLFDYFFGKKIIRNASAFTALTETEKQELHQLFSVPGEKIAVVPNGVDLAQFCKMPAKNALRKKFSIPNEKSIVLFLGRINKMKGLDLLLEAFASMRKNAVLVVAGNFEGSERNYGNEIMRLISGLGLQDRVIFTGPVSGKEKLAAYSGADVFVLPSRYEAFGLVLLEAMASSLPVIATKNSALAAQLLESNAALVVDWEKGQLAKAIENVLSDKKTAGKLVRNSRKFARQFSWEKTVERLGEVYERVGAGKNS